jgi:hypothetical protein
VPDGLLRAAFVEVPADHAGDALGERDRRGEARGRELVGLERVSVPASFFTRAEETGRFLPVSLMTTSKGRASSRPSPMGTEKEGNLRPSAA